VYLITYMTCILVGYRKQLNVQHGQYKCNVVEISMIFLQMMWTYHLNIQVIKGMVKRSSLYEDKTFNLIVSPFCFKMSLYWEAHTFINQNYLSIKKFMKIETAYDAFPNKLMCLLKNYWKNPLPNTRNTLFIYWCLLF